MNHPCKILLIENDPAPFTSVLPGISGNNKVTIHTIASVEEFALAAERMSYDIVFLNVSFGGVEKGLELLEQAISSLENALIIAVVPETHRHILPQVIALSPFFYISSPCSEEEIRISYNRAVEFLLFRPTHGANNSTSHQFDNIIGRSTSMKNLFELIGRVADDDLSTVLIRGESGTGKELVAKAIHSHSNRKNKKFVPVNCAAIPDELLESELFGHVKGAFTGATQNKLGRIQYADGGTLFLDEIGDMKTSLQAKLLRVLQEKEFEPVGGLQPRPVDTRILAATHCNLEELVEQGLFREDLYYRLSVIPINIPSLSQRREDIPLLTDFFIDSYTTGRGRESFLFSQEAMDLLMRYSWKGNVRELENLIQHMSILYSGKTVNKEDLPEKFLDPANHTDEPIPIIDAGMNHLSERQPQYAPQPQLGNLPFPDGEINFNEMVNNFETELILRALEAAKGNKKEAARLLCLKRTTLLEKIKKKGLNS